MIFYQIPINNKLFLVHCFIGQSRTNLQLSVSLPLNKVFIIIIIIIVITRNTIFAVTQEARVKGKHRVENQREGRVVCM